MPINKYSGEFQCNINGINVGTQYHSMWLVLFSIIPFNNPETHYLNFLLIIPSDITNINCISFSATLLI
jgi:hypothetical protein